MLMAGNNRKTQFLLKQAIHFYESCQLRMINLKIPRKANQMFWRANKENAETTYVHHQRARNCVSEQWTLYSHHFLISLYLLLMVSIDVCNHISVVSTIAIVPYMKKRSKIPTKIHFHQICIKNKSRQSKNEKYSMYRKVVNTYFKITQWSS